MISTEMDYSVASQRKLQRFLLKSNYIQGSRTLMLKFAILRRKQQKLYFPFSLQEDLHGIYTISCYSYFLIEFLILTNNQSLITMKLQIKLFYYKYTYARTHACACTHTHICTLTLADAEFCRLLQGHSSGTLHSVISLSQSSVYCGFLPR